MDTETSAPAKVTRDAPTLEQRTKWFWKKVDKLPDLTACWRWTGAVDGNGWGVFVYDTSRTTKAHRVSYALAHQFPIKDIRGEHIIQTCGDKLCVNPHHLQLGGATRRKRKHGL